MKDPETALFWLQAAHSVKDVAHALDLDPEKFFYVLQNTETGKYYKNFEIPKKSGGTRQISKPRKGLALSQDRLAPILHHKYSPGPFVKGFVRGTSFVENARYHEKQRWILNIDLEDFFPSISFPRVRGLFMSKHFHFNDRVATILARICTYQDALPQGASTSPILANIIAKNLDNRLIKIARKDQLKFTRYSDDITFSSSKKEVPKSLVFESTFVNERRSVVLSPELIEVVRDSGFRINSKKSRLMMRNERQEVTGLIVNTRTNLWRRDVSRIRMKLHSAGKFGLEEAGKLWLGRDGTAFSKHIEGWLAYVRQVKGSDDPVLGNLCRLAIETSTTSLEWIKMTADVVKQFDVFLSHASEDKEKVRKLKDALEDRDIRVFFDEDSIKWGDSIVEKVNFGLKKSQYFLPFLTKNFSSKGWPNKELNTAIQANITQKSRILPIKEASFSVEGEYPLLNDILYKTWPSKEEEELKFVEDISDEILAMIEKAKH